MNIKKIKHGLLVILTSGILAAALGCVTGTFFIKPEYTSTARYYLLENSTDTSDTEKYQNINANSCIYLFNSDIFFDEIVLNSKLDYTSRELSSMISVHPIENSCFFDISITSESASDAYQLHQSIKSVKDYYLLNATNDTMTANIIDEADLPLAPSYPDVIMVTLSFAVIGFVLGILLLCFLRKKKVSYTPDEPQEEIDLKYPIITQIPSVRTSKINGNVLVGNRASLEFNNAFRNLYDELKYKTENPCNVITICSAQKNDGKTTVAVNLAITAAKKNMRVLLLDCDFRNSSMSRYFRMYDNQPGFSNIIKGETKPENTIITTPFESLFLLYSGFASSNPMTLLTNPQLPNILWDLRCMFDYIIIDTPPLCDASDAFTLTGFTDSLLLVCRNKKTDDEEVKKAISNIELYSKIKLTGLILNDIKIENTETDIPFENVSFKRSKVKKNNFINYEI